MKFQKPALFPFSSKEVPKSGGPLGISYSQSLCITETVTC